MRYAIGNMLRAALILFAALSVNAQTDPGWTSGQYGYDGAGNIITIGADTFDYDALGRLLRATLKVPPDEQSKTYEIEYDPYGNIVKMPGPDGTVKTFGVDSNTNRVTISNSTTNAYATYDAAGRLKNTLGGNGDEFEYDALDAVTRSKVQGVTKVHLYTASGERIASVTVNASTPVRSDWTLRDLSGKVLRRFEKNGADWSWEEDYIYAGDRLLAAEVGDTGQTLHFHVDHLGTPRLITDQRGGSVSEHKYMPFGEEITSPTQDAEKLKFTGHERDADRLDYMHARYYFPKWGRFLSVDPYLDLYRATRNPQNWNRYAYVRNNPINLVDPDGRDDVNIGPDFEVAGASNPEKDREFFKTLGTAVVGYTSLAVATVLLDPGPEFGDGELPQDRRDATPRRAGKGPATTEPTLPDKTLATDGKVKIYHNYKSGDHGHAHAHVSGGGPDTRIGPNGKPAFQGDAPMTRAQQKVYDANKSRVRRAINKIGRWLAAQVL